MAAVLEQLLMKWWREQWRREEPFGIPMIFWWIAWFVAETTIPLVVVAVGMSLVVPVELSTVILAVVAGWPSQWALLPAIGWPVKIAVALAWVIGVYVTVLLLDEAALLIIIPASPIAAWAIVKLEDWKEDRDADEANRGLLDAGFSSRYRSERDDPQISRRKRAMYADQADGEMGAEHEAQDPP